MHVRKGKKTCCNSSASDRPILPLSSADTESDKNNSHLACFRCVPAGQETTRVSERQLINAKRHFGSLQGPTIDKGSDHRGGQNGECDCSRNKIKQKVKL